MSKASELISNYFASSSAKPDSNLANDSLHLGGVKAEDYALKTYVSDVMENLKTLLTEYINTRDSSVLASAKAYTDLMINSQDFSDFAKLTDLQALRRVLEEEISSSASSSVSISKDYTDTKIGQVNQAILTLNQYLTEETQQRKAKDDELFQYVSNGKTKVARAITDKGVSTSSTDTFDTMATNIRAIPQQGGGTDTSDATAIASDILQGKTAYARGQKLYGTLVAPNSHEENPVNPYPTMAEAELVYGVLPGHMTMINTDTSVPAVPYAISCDRKYLAKYNQSGSKIEILEYKDGGYKKIHHITPSSDYYLEYTLSELGIELNEDLEISDMKFSSLNTNDDESAYYCMLAICLRRKSSTLSETVPSWKVHIYKFNTYDGTIFTENETGEGYTLLNKYVITSENTSTASVCNITFHPTDMRKIVVCESRDIYRLHTYILNKYSDPDTYVNRANINAINHGSAAIPKYKGMGRISYLNDRIITYDEGNSVADGDCTCICIFNQNGILIKRTEVETRVAITTDGLHALRYDGKLYSVIINYTTGAVSFQAITNVAVINPEALRKQYSSAGYNIQPYWFDKTGRYIFLYNVSYGTSIYYINNFEQTEALELVNNYPSNGAYVLSNLSNFISNLSGNICLFFETEDTSVVTGIRYQGNMYYSAIYDPEFLTAKPSDVKAGKTFVGKEGIYETGTLEVNE